MDGFWSVELKGIVELLDQLYDTIPLGAEERFMVPL
jgi:hypothetical protein